LMIAFIIPSVAKRPALRSDIETVGRIGDERITYLDLQRAKAEWDMASRVLHITRPMSMGAGGVPQMQTFGFAELMLMQRLQPIAMQMGLPPYILARRVIQQIDPITYLLLLREARQMGVQINHDVAQKILPNLEVAGAEDPEFAETAIVDWLTILQA